MSDRPFGLYTTKFRDENGKVYDLAKFEFLPEDLHAVDAWVELVKESGGDDRQRPA